MNLNSQGYNIGSNPYADSKGVYWKGNDGKVYVKGAQGVNAAGNWDANTEDYWFNQGYSRISNPSNSYPQLAQGAETTTPNVSSNNTAGRSYDTALYDQAIGNLESSQGALDAQERIGLDNVAKSYQNILDRLLSARNTAEGEYTGAKTQNTIQNQKNRSQIDFETGQRANALQRLLGSKGSGASTAARVAAPYAAALEGTQQLNQVGDTYAQNQNALDQNWNTYITNYDQSQKDLEAQRLNQENAVKSDVIGKRQTLLNSLAELRAKKASAAGGNPVAASQGTFDQANALNGQIANLGQQYYGRVNVASPEYKAPDLAKYSYDPRGAVGVSSGIQSQAVSPYLSLLLNGKKKEQAL